MIYVFVEMPAIISGCMFFACAVLYKLIVQVPIICFFCRLTFIASPDGALYAKLS